MGNADYSEVSTFMMAITAAAVANDLKKSVSILLLLNFAHIPDCNDHC